jgi:sideroflexin-5
MLSIRSLSLKQPSLNNSLRSKLSPSGMARRKKSAMTTNETEMLSKGASSTQSVPVAQSLLAAAAGVGVVSGAAFLVENATAASVPHFDPKGQRYGADSFAGRFSRMLLACDPRLLLYTEEQVRASLEMVLNYQQVLQSSNNAETHRQLWEAKRVTDAAVHPDTGDVIPRPFRMSGYVTYNGPVCVAMVASQSTMPLLFWSWVNQSQNALVNYYNRNASSPMSNETLAKSYAAAVGSAIAVAFGLATLIQKRFDAQKAKSMLRWVAFPSAVVASSLNCYIVRSPEIVSGIPLLDKDGNDVLPGETSQEAATRGVHSTTLSRALLQAPVYFLPPLLVSSGPLQRVIAKNPTAAVPITTFLLLVAFGVGLPATVAVFPQIAEIEPDQVEDKFKHLRHPKTLQPYTSFYYNKGL